MPEFWPFLWELPIKESKDSDEEFQITITHDYAHMLWQNELNIIDWIININLTS